MGVFVVFYQAHHGLVVNVVLSLGTEAILRLNTGPYCFGRLLMATIRHQSFNSQPAPLKAEAVNS